VIGTDLNIELAANISSQAEDRKLKKACQGFESLFVLQLLKSMRSASMSDDSGSGLGKETFLSIADQSFADFIGQKEGLGIAKILCQYFQKDKATGGETELQATDKRHIPLDHKELTSLTSKLARIDTNIAGKLPDLQKLKNGIDLKIHYTTESGQTQNAGRIIDKRNTGTDKNTELNAIEKQLADKMVFNQPIDAAVDKASKEYDLPKNLLVAMIRAESGGDPNAVSPKGAKGLMQLIDSTATDMGVKDQFDPEENIMGGAKYIKQLLDHFKGDLKLSLAAYNAGPGNVRKFDGIPPFSETKDYINKVIRFMNEGNPGKDSRLLADKPYKEEG
jgi:Rod binding domain-containing protein